MKRLKLYSLFLGSALPWYLAAALLIFTLSLTSAFDLPDGIGIFLTIALPLALLAGYYVLDHRLTPKEQQIVQQTEPAQWRPVPPELAARIAKEMGGFQPKLITRLLISAGVGLLVFLFAYLTDNGNITVPAAIAGGVAGLVFLILTICRALNRRRTNMDDSAEYALIPIHSKRYLTTGGQIVTQIEITFYQPDGRYVLRTKPGLDGNFVAVVKNRGSLTWLVLPEPLPEE